MALAPLPLVTSVKRRQQCFNNGLYNCSCTLISLEEVLSLSHTHTHTHMHSLLRGGFLRQMVERPSWIESAFV